MKLTELQQTNAIIGLSMRIENWPETLAEAGYALDRIELRLTIPSRNEPGKDIEVNPDLLFANDSKMHYLVVELKSGTFHGFKQLDGLLGLSPLHLIRAGKVSPSKKKIVISVTQIINHEHIGEYKPEFERVKCQANLISINNGKSIKSAYGTIKDGNLDNEFQKGVSLRQCMLPTGIIEILPTSETREIANATANAVKVFWLDNHRTLNPTQVAEKVFKKLFNLIDASTRNNLLHTIKETLKEMACAELQQYMRATQGTSDDWTMLNLPEQQPRNNLTKAKQRFQKAIEIYKDRKFHGTPYKKDLFSQMSIEDVEELYNEATEELRDIEPKE